MRHRKKFNHLGRKSAHRKAMLSNMATSLIIHKRIKTTTAKAKALKIYVEPLITKSKEDSTHSRRMAFRRLQDKEAVNELFREVSPKIVNRPGGYTRILKTGNRLGDNAEMCIIELVDYNDNMLTETKETRKSSSRRRRSRKKSDKGETETTAKDVETKSTEEKSEAKKAEASVETEKKEEKEKQAKANDDKEEKSDKPEAKKEDNSADTEKEDGKEEEKK